MSSEFGAEAPLDSCSTPVRIGSNFVPQYMELIQRMAPKSEQELMLHASALAGKTLGEAAGSAGWSVPADFKRAKGWTGCLLEVLLGATAGSRAQPDFEALGVELKTIPLRLDGTPLETTFVCTVDLLSVAGTEWQDSRVFRKLRRVLWVPVQGDRAVAVASRRIGTPFLWSPTSEQEATLRWDWEELAGRIGTGDVDSITGHAGVCLQIRPKATDSRARRRGIDRDGQSISVLPRGFYLRQKFTAAIIAAQFGSGVSLDRR